MLRSNRSTNEHAPSSFSNGLRAKVSLRHHALVCTGLAVIVFYVFSPVLDAEFLGWDDPRNFLNNVNFRGFSKSNLVWMFTEPFFGHYQPLTWLTFAIDHELYGMNPYWMHFVTLTFHIVATFSAYSLFFTMFSIFFPMEKQTIGHALVAAFSAAVFGLHPFATEPVGWLSARGFTACAIFYFLSVKYYLLAHRAGVKTRRKYTLLSIVSALVSLGFREWAVTLPVVFLILDEYPLRRVKYLSFHSNSLKKAAVVFAEKIPLFGLVAFFLVMAWISRTQDPFIQSADAHPYPIRFMHSFTAILFYLEKFLIPLNLLPYYMTNGGENFFYHEHVLNLVLFSIICIICACTRHKFPAALTAWAIFLVTLSPTLWIAQHELQLAANRYAYMVMTPVIALISFTIWGVTSHVRWGRRVLTVSSLLILVALGTISHSQSKNWINDEALWKTALKIDPDNYVALLMEAHTIINSNKNINDAEKTVDRLMEKHPGHRSYDLLGQLRLKQGRFEEAEAALIQSIHLTKTLKGFIHMAFVQGSLEEFGECEKWLDLVFEEAPENPIAHYLKGKVDVVKGRFNEAMERFNRSIRINHLNSEVFRDRALLHYTLENHEAAFADMNQSIALYPDDPLTYFYRGQWLLNAGDQSGAIRDFETSLRLDPALKSEYEKLGLL